MLYFCSVFSDQSPAPSTFRFPSKPLYHKPPLPLHSSPLPRRKPQPKSLICATSASLPSNKTKTPKYPKISKNIHTHKPYFIQKLDQNLALHYPLIIKMFTYSRTQSLARLLPIPLFTRHGGRVFCQGAGREDKGVVSGGEAGGLGEAVGVGVGC